MSKKNAKGVGADGRRLVTRDDLPSVDDIGDTMKKGGYIPPAITLHRILDVVVAHLNERGGIPAEKPQKSDYVLNNGKCCEKSQLLDNELARRNEELSEVEEAISALVNELARTKKESQAEIAALTKRAEKAEAERDEWKKEAEKEAYNGFAMRDKVQRKLDAAEAERDEARGSRDYWIDLYGELRDELQAKLDAAENRPEGAGSSRKENGSADSSTLDREAVKTILFRNFQNRPPNFDRAEKELSALAFETANAWPEWLGPKPERRVAKRSTLGFEVDGLTFLSNKPIETYERHLRNTLLDATRYAAVIEAKKSEQAATGDEDQRVEELAGLLTGITDDHQRSVSPSMARVLAEAVDRAGWTPPESEE